MKTKEQQILIVNSGWLGSDNPVITDNVGEAEPLYPLGVMEENKKTIATNECDQCIPTLLPIGVEFK